MCNAQGDEMSPSVTVVVIIVSLAWLCVCR